MQTEKSILIKKECLRNYNITFSEITHDAVPLHLRTSENNRFPRFREAFLKQILILLQVILGNISE